MKENDFRELVRELRKNQKNFFATRNVSYLNESKKLEKKVDAELSQNPVVEQQEIFPL